MHFFFLISQQASTGTETTAPGGSDLRGTGVGSAASEASFAERDDAKAATNPDGNAVPVPRWVWFPRAEGQLWDPTIPPG